MTTAITDMSGWDNNFVYRTNVGFWTFVIAMLIAFAVALLTMSYKSIKAAVANPVESLRYE